MTEVQTNILDEDQIDTVLAPDVEFSGVIQFSKSFMIKGTISGKIEATGDLYIEKDAHVKADIKAGMLSLKGTVIGNIKADKRVDLSATCSLDGDIIAPEVTMETGCKFNGICQMTGTKPK